MKLCADPHHCVCGELDVLIPTILFHCLCPIQDIKRMWMHTMAAEMMKEA
jgi:hypothetical protein